MLSTILVPVDGTEYSEHALRFAAELARKFESRLVLAHVLLRGTSVPALQELAENKGFLDEIKDDIADVEIVPIASVAGVAAPVEVVPDDALKHCGELLLDRARDSVEGVNDIQLRILDDDPAHAILKCADDEGAELIILGSRGVGDLKSLLLGSVSHKVVENAKCPCVVIK